MGTLGMELCPGTPPWRCEEGVRVAVPRPGGWVTAGHAHSTPAVTPGWFSLPPAGAAPSAAAAAAPHAFDIETGVRAVMAAKGWAKGALFQQRWFAGPAKVMDPKLRLRDTSLAAENGFVTMKWVCGFPRAKAVRDGIFSAKAWLTDNAKAEWKRRLDTDFARPENAKATQVSFGKLKLVGRAAYEQHLTYAPMDQITEPGGAADDLLASLGRFSFFAIPEGTADRTADGYRVTLANLGVIVADYFDFDGFQPLGWWALPDKMEMPSNWEAGKAKVQRGWVLNDRPGFTWVDNQSYRDFRATHRRGEDFVVFSDVEINRVNETFVIPHK